MEKIKTDLDFTNDIKFQKRASIIKKIGFIIMLSIVLASIGGVFGYSFNTLKNSADKYGSVKYERFLHVTKETPLTFMAITNDSIADISIPVKYFEKINVKTISPKPFKEFTCNNFYTFRFLIKNTGVQTIVFNCTPIKAGNVSISISINNKGYSINQFIYP